MLKKESWVINKILLIYFLKHIITISWLENKEAADTTSRKSDKEKPVDLSNMTLLQGNKEQVKEGKELKIFTPNNLLTRLLILLAQTKSGHNSYKFKNEIRQVIIIKPL